MKKLSKYCIAFFALFFLCASQKEVINNKEDKVVKERAKLDTKTILLDNVNSKKKQDEVKIEFLYLRQDTVSDSVKQEKQEKRVIKDGFRVQVMVTNSRNTALSLKKILKQKFNNYEIYLIYKKPLYKIRIGDFLDKKEAERLRRRLIANGYKDSWVVSDEVVVNVFSGDGK